MTHQIPGVTDAEFIAAQSGGITRGFAQISDSHIPRYDLARYPRGSDPRVVLFSAYNAAYAPLAAIAAPNWKAYCGHHGYGLRLYPNGFHLDPGYPATYGDKGKFQWYYELCGNADILMFLDIDSLFTSFETRIEDWVDAPSAPVQRLGVPSRAPFFWTYDDSGPLSGLFIARTDDMTERHLRKAYELAAAENNVRHGRIEPNGISDQDAMRRLMNVPPFTRTFAHCYPAETVGHCYPENWLTGKWLVTFPGRSFADKLSGMREWAQKVKQ